MRIERWLHVISTVLIANHQPDIIIQAVAGSGQTLNRASSGDRRTQVRHATQRALVEQVEFISITPPAVATE